MKTKRNKMFKKRKGKSSKSKTKKWITAIDAAQSTLSKTGSISKARAMLRLQAAKNSRKLFGSI